MFCGSFQNPRLIASHKLTAGVLGDRWYQAKNPRNIAAVLLRRLKTPAKLKICKKNKIIMLLNFH
jgi:hypothetical protein